MRNIPLLSLIGLLGAISLSCGEREDDRILLATTTSLEDSGILSYLIEAFETECEITVRAVAVGSGRSLQLGREGEVDLLLTHSPDEERIFMAEGHGSARKEFTVNCFIVVGPSTDPAGIRGIREGDQALLTIQQSKSLFLSRGDGSGTHTREKDLWRKAGIVPEWDGYRETGQGMGATLQIAAEVGGYTLYDTGTFARWKSRLDLEALAGGSPEISNTYSVIRVNPGRHPHINAKSARRLAEWLVSEHGQTLIADFRIGDEHPFIPIIHRDDSALSMPLQGSQPDTA